jgi:hypothetical protein
MRRLLNRGDRSVTTVWMLYRIRRCVKSRTLSCVAIILLSVTLTPGASAQKKKSRTRLPPPPPPTELTKLREEYVKATNDYKANLEKLLVRHEGNVSEAEKNLAVARQLFAEGLIAKVRVDENEAALKSAKDKLAEVRRQMDEADTQVAEMLVEAKADEEIARSLRRAKGGLLRTTAFIRYAGVGGWGLSEAWKIQRFFSDTFNKQLPVAVFGQGAIHERWRLDHRNAMDISLHPDGVEGQALLQFLQKNGIPYSAFRSAIPGTATGPHIHIGRPSHRY